MAENGVLTIKRAWSPLADVSWRNIESIFEVHEQKTPPRRIVGEPALPAAPRKSQPQIRRQGLKPRRLTYDLSSPDSGIIDDKENQPPIQESSENTIPNSQPKVIIPGSLRDRVNRWIETHFYSQ